MKWLQQLFTHQQEPRTFRRGPLFFSDFLHQGVIAQLPKYLLLITHFSEIKKTANDDNFNSRIVYIDFLDEYVCGKLATTITINTPAGYLQET